MIYSGIISEINMANNVRSSIDVDLTEISALSNAENADTRFLSE